MEPTSDAELFDMRDFKVALRAVREAGKLVAHVAVSSPTGRKAGLVIEEITADIDYIDGNVAVLRFEFDGSDSDRSWTRLARPHVIEDGAALEYVALMYGPKAGPLKLAAVKIVQDG